MHRWDYSFECIIFTILGGRPVNDGVVVVVSGYIVAHLG